MSDMDVLMNKLLHMSNMEMDENYKNAVYSNLATNPYRLAMKEAMLEYKERKRTELDHSIYNRMKTPQRLQAVLDDTLMAQDLQLTEDEKKDEELVEAEKKFLRNMQEIKCCLDEGVELMAQNSIQMENEMDHVLKEHMRWRPIDQTDLDRAQNNVRIIHENSQNELKNTATNAILIRKSYMDDLRKRRRNFNKDAIGKLQKWYDQHSDHPYPSDEEKMIMAAECEISIQQVANWFGNKRIRMKKVQKPIQGHDEPVYDDEEHFMMTNNHQAMPYHFENSMNEQQVSEGKA